MILFGHEKYSALTFLEQAFDNIDRIDELLDLNLPLGLEWGQHNDS